MEKINKEVLKKVANNLMFDMTDEEYDTLLNEFDVLVQQFELMSSIEGLEDVEPMSFPFDVTTDYLREDVPMEPIKREDALASAKDVVEGQIRLPKVVG